MVFGILLIIVAICFIRLGYIIKKDKRSLALGVWTFNSVVALGIFVLALFVANTHLLPEWLMTLIMGGILFVLFLLLILPFFILLLFLINGILILWKEGIKLRNVLTLLMTFLILFYLVFWPSVGSIIPDGPAGYLYVYVGFIFGFTIVWISVYGLSNYLNQIHFFVKHIDYIVVLGCALNKDQVTPLLASRVDKALKLARKHPEATVIFSGGQGSDELISEAMAMANYASSQGFEVGRMLLEEHSSNTKENIENSYAMMKETKQVALVTSNYHVLRALMIAKTLGVSCVGYGAKTKLYFALNAFLREFVGYLYLYKKQLLRLLAYYTFGYLVLIAIKELLELYFLKMTR